MFELINVDFGRGDVQVEVSVGGQVSGRARFGHVGIISHTEDQELWAGCQWFLTFDDPDSQAFGVALQVPPDSPRAAGLPPNVLVNIPAAVARIIVQAVLSHAQLSGQISTTSASFRVQGVSPVVGTRGADAIGND